MYMAVALFEETVKETWSALGVAGRKGWGLSLIPVQVHFIVKCCLLRTIFFFLPVQRSFSSYFSKAYCAGEMKCQPETSSRSRCKLQCALGTCLGSCFRFITQEKPRRGSVGE